MQKVMVRGQSVTPSKIVCVGRNYVAHVQELGNEIPEQMVFFIKPNSAISTTLVSIHQEPLHYESELSFVYEDGRFVAVGLGLDLTKRGLQSKLKSKGLPWERAKSFDGSALFSPFVAFKQLDLLTLELEINGKTRQSGGVDLMMHTPDAILKELQSFMTLEDGDIVMTGTPEGVGLVGQGDQFLGRVLENGRELIAAEWLAE